MMMTTSRPRLDAVLRDAGARIDSNDARALLAHALACPSAWLFAHGDDTIDEDTLHRFEALLARCAQGEPVAYLIGRRGFWSFDLMVSPQTLIPRPETELLVERALQRIGTQPHLRIADLGTGSGAIALALAHERPHAQVIAVDVSAGALDIARANAHELRLYNVEFRQGDWLQPLAGERFDLIASNPPYIADGDPHLDALRYEPEPALSSGRDGLDAIRIITRDAPAHLHAGGWLLLEHGWDQGDAVRALLQGAGFEDVQTHRDLEDRDRVTLGRCVGDDAHVDDAMAHYALSVPRRPGKELVMPVTNEMILAYAFLDEMYRDDYFPDVLVDKGKAILLRLCANIEQGTPADLNALYALTHAATDEFNALAEEFYEHDSEIETAARDCIGTDFAFIARIYGFDADIEALIATRDW